MPERTGTARGGATSESVDRVQTETLAIIGRLSRARIDPDPRHELMADLGYDSLLVLELVGELEDHFDIAVPLNDLTHIRTVEQIVAAVHRLVAAPERPA